MDDASNAVKEKCENTAQKPIHNGRGNRRPVEKKGDMKKKEKRRKEGEVIGSQKERGKASGKQNGLGRLIPIQKRRVS